MRRLPFDRLNAFSDLFAAYTADFSALEAFYAGSPWDEDARADAARRAVSGSEQVLSGRAAEAPRDRDAVADALEAQNTNLSADGSLSEKTRAHLGALRDPEGVAVVTGQQVGLFTGPLYTVYKTLTALQLAERLREETGRPVAPVFWLEGEDHDFAEIAAARFLRRNEPAEVRLPAPDTSGLNGGPVGRKTFEGAMPGVLDDLDAALPDSDFKPALMEAVRGAYAPETPLLVAFARLLRAFFPEAGLVFIDPNDRRMKAHAAPLFRQEIEAPAASSEHVEAAGRKLEAAGFHAQIGARPSNLFLLTGDGRLPLDFDGDRFTLRGTDRSFSERELLGRLDEAPERFSPNVVLRPLMQDRLLPTAAYVGGPAEIAYHGQLGGVYEQFGVARPLLYPRASVTLVERKVQKVLDKFDLDVDAVEEDLERLFQRVVRQEMEADVDELFGAAQPPIHQALSELKPQVEAVDRTLGSAVEAARAEIAGTLEALKGKTLRAEKRGQDEVRAQLQKARANLFPGGVPQERVLNVLHYLAKYGGTQLLDDLFETLTLETDAHQVVAV